MNRVFIVLVACIYLAGCGATSHIMIGDKRQPTLIGDVKIYMTPPKSYEQIAIVDSSSKNSMAITDQGKTDVAINRLKDEAASLGANGILLSNSGDISTGSAGIANAYSYGNSATMYGISASVMHKFAKGLAIYVTEQ